MSNPISSQPIEASIGHHHVHRDDEPLPGAKGAEPTVDYSPDTIDHTRLPPSEEGNTQDLTPHTRSHHEGHHHEGHHPRGPTGAVGAGGDTLTEGNPFMSPTTEYPTAGRTGLSGAGGITDSTNDRSGGFSGNTGRSDANALTDKLTDHQSGGFGGNTGRSDVSAFTDKSTDHHSAGLGGNTGRSDASAPTGKSTEQHPSGGLGGSSGPSGAGATTDSTTKPSFGDKVVGKTQELAGKVLKKDGLQEKGELRQQGERI